MKIVKILLFILLAGMKPAFSQNADAVVGNWLNAEKDAKVQIYKAGGKYYGKIVWLKEPNEADGKTPKKDKKNSSEALRSRPILNLVILTEFTYDDGKWDDGEIYDPKSGKTYSSNMKLKGDKLEIRGYVGISAFGRTTTWTRAS
ncbi:DUF2147 domain-containing protein [Niastella caeni]|uniref:DUF2147 domain-containing protein n=2 Tax=Niastella caeni TaxID=2569763 RepID=A0A4S8HYE2_9BACT|nr:DUF2147 domain-containing protein [Niastella caeni]